MNFRCNANTARLLISGLLLIASLHLSALAQTCSIPGQAGAADITAQPNTFFPGTANAGANSTSVTVGAATGVSRGIFPGDLLLIIQMQGADFNTNNDNDYGDGSLNTGVSATVAYGAPGYAGGVSGINFQAGKYEWAVATSQIGTGGGSIQLSAPLANSYAVQAGDASGSAFRRNFQVIRVPQYSRANVSGTIDVQPWDGTTGGVLAVDVTGALAFSGATINGNGRGFRGGGSYNVFTYLSWCLVGGTSQPPASCWHYRQSRNIADTWTYWGAYKGEGCSGTPQSVYSSVGGLISTSVAYPGGDLGRGAPCNAGGGGNAHNAGGGGGGNGNAGGNGGNSWTQAAGTVGSPIGGFGGAPSWATSGLGVNRLFMGGGGGAGDVGGNPSTAPDGSGGAGGGIVILHASTISGNATINVNGEAGISARATDAAGGGGAGGTVVIKANSQSGSIVVNANGGAGGAYTISNHVEQDGPGGGGGGGMLFSNLSGVVFNASGGAAGLSNSTRCDPATPGADCGQRPGFSTSGPSGYSGYAPGARTGYECLPNLTVTKTTTTPTITSATSAVANYVLNISNAGGGARQVNAMDWTLPPGWTLAAPPTYQYGQASPNALAAGAEAAPAAPSSTWSVAAAPLSIPSTGSNTLTWSAFALPPATNGLPGSMTISFAVNVPDTATAGTYHNPAGVVFLDPTRAAGVGTATVTPATNYNANRLSTPYGSTTFSGYDTGSTAVPGSNYSGLQNGPTTDDVVLLPNFRLVKTASVGTATVGTPFSYTLGLENIGRGIGAQLFAQSQVTSRTLASIFGSPYTVTDTLPAGLTATGITTVGGSMSCSGTGTGTVNCSQTSFTSIAAGSPSAPTPITSITIAVSPLNVACGTSVLNTATVAVLQIGESSTADNTATLTLPTNCLANLQIAKTHAGSPLAAGKTVDYSITLSNSGPSPGDGSVVKDVPGNGLSACTVTNCQAVGAASCPASAQWPNILPPNAGLTLANWPANSGLNFSVRCEVTATGY